jgi:hypothetical protein
MRAVSFEASAELIPVRHRAQLNQVAQDVVRRVCRDRLGIMKRPPVVEIDFVASLVENGAGFLEAEWGRILAQDRIAVRVAGVFCHQSPMVRITGKPPRRVPTRTCELADLLVLHSHARSDGKVFWRGVLMQAKSHSGQRVVPEEPQLWLYQDWPNFVITAPGFNRRQRDFSPDQRSGLYALVSNKGWQVLPASNPLVGHSMGSLDFSEFLVNMLYDMDPAQPGRMSVHGRQVYQNSKRDWSPTIWELMEVTANRALRHKGKKRGLYDRDLSRLGGGVLQMMRDVAIQHSVAPPGYGGVEGEEGWGEGISILVIETRSAD